MKDKYTRKESLYSKRWQVNQPERLENYHNFVGKLPPVRDETVTSSEKFFLGGFFEGEASLYASIKYNKTARFGFYVDPEFAVYQHTSGLQLLQRAKMLFQTGHIYRKPGSETVWNYVVYNRRTLSEKVIPFYEKYVFPFSAKRETYISFKELVTRLDKKEHFTKEGMREIVKLAYSMNPFSKGKERKKSLQEILNLLESSETIRLTAVLFL